MTSAWASSTLHADLDAFYASVEILRSPELKGKPVIVGGTSSRGVVTSASYEARNFGVRSAMPTSRARRICPNGVFIQPHFPAYIQASRQVREVFDSFSPVVEPLSLDEAFLDVTRARRMWSSPPTVAEALKDRVFKQTGLVLSVGIGPNKFVAKVASKHAKPDGVVAVDAGKVTDFLHPLGVEELWGVGQQTATVLRRLGLMTIGDVARVGKAPLERVLGSMGLHIANLALGRDERKVIPDAPRKSVGAEETFEKDLIEEIQIHQALLKLADRVASRLRAEGISGKTVMIKIRLANFSTLSRSRTLTHEVDTTSGVYGVARDLLERFLDVAEAGRQRIRLLGVSVTNLSEWPASEQLTFNRRPRWTQADRALDGVRLRFGEDSLQFGSLISDPWEQ